MMFCVANSGRVRAINSAQGAPKFRKFRNSFAGFWHKICVISTPSACFFGAERTMGSVQSFGDGIRFAQRVLAANNEFCARGAPKFRKIYISFVKFLRGFRVISTPDARVFECQRPYDLVKSFEDVMRVSAHEGRVHVTFCARAAPKIFGNFARESSPRVDSQMDK